MIRKQKDNNFEKNDEGKMCKKSKRAVKQVLAGGLLIISTVCLTASGLSLYTTYEDNKVKQRTNITYSKSKIEKEVEKKQIEDYELSESPFGNIDEIQLGRTQNNQLKDETKNDTTQNKVSKKKNSDTDKKKNVPPCKVRGIYVTGPMAGSKNNMNKLIDLVDTTELNAMVIDIKNDSGEVTCKLDNKVAEEIGATTNYISNIEELVSRLKEKNVYLIARIVAFKDPILAEQKPDLSLKNANGTIFRDRSNLAWVNPYKKEVWEYLVSLGKNAAELGFDEVQYDYIRFSTDSGMKQVDFGVDTTKKTKIQAITSFTKYAYEQLDPLGIYVAADVYGTIINSEVDAKIVGQSYAKMAKYLDYICPMIYPSHYGSGVYGIKYPDLEPYQLIKNALEDSKEVLKNRKENEHQAIVRPWLQDFTATWVDKHQTYGAKEIKEQIKGVYDAGYEEWILWNGSNKYTKSGLDKHE